MTKGQLERFAGFMLQKYMPKSASVALHEIASGQHDKKVQELHTIITDMAINIDTQDRDKIIDESIEKLREAYRFYGS